jgi:hypothetical protein
MYNIPYTSLPGDDEHRAIAEACCTGEAGNHYLYKQGACMCV